MFEVTHLLGVLLALSAAIAAACNRLFVRKGTENRTANDVVYFVMLLATLVIVPPVALVYYPNYQLTTTSWLAFLGAGLFGTLLGNVFLYTSIKQIGASRTQPIVASNVLIAVFLGVVLLGESLSLIHGVGVLLIITGVVFLAIETSHENPDNLSRNKLVWSLLIPFGAALAFGSEPIFANFGFAEGTPALVGLAIKTSATWVGLTAYLRWKNALPPVSGLRGSNAKWIVLAGLAYVLFLIGYYIGLEIAPVNIIVPIIITNTMFVILLSAIFMPGHLEMITWKLVIAALLVVSGASLITIFG